MIRRLLAAALLCAGSGAGSGAMAEAPLTSPRPAPRAGGDVEVSADPALPRVLIEVSYRATIRPRPRPRFAPRPAVVRQLASALAVRVSLRPAPRPQNLRRRATVRRAGVRATPQPQPTAARAAAGRLCGVRGIEGQPVQPVPGRIAGCGIGSPVKVTAVDGVVLSQASLMDCTTAKALHRWVKGSVRPAVGRLGGGVRSLRVAAHYSCRTRNNQPGARISEHGKGKAIDISAIRLRNGVDITVLRGWNDPAHKRLLRRLHRDACGPFGTVLGPAADRFHRDHFHFDTARHQGGTYCR